MSKTIKIIVNLILTLGLLIVLFFFIRACVNLSVNVGLKEQFSENDYLKILTPSIAHFSFMFLMIIFHIYLLLIFLKKGSLIDNIKGLYKYKSQIVNFILVILVSFITRFIFANHLGVMVQLNAFAFVLILTVLIINIFHFNKNIKA